MTIEQLHHLVETYVNIGTYALGAIIVFCLTYVFRRILGHYEHKKGTYSLECCNESFWASFFTGFLWPISVFFITSWLITNTIEKVSEFLASRFVSK